MLTRIYIDNFRCFESFEYQPERQHLIHGANGSGKSSLLDAILIMRQIAVASVLPDSLNLLAQRSRWSTRPRQTFELEAQLDEDRYVYQLVIEQSTEQFRTQVSLETVRLNGHPLFEFNNGEVRLFTDDFHLKFEYPSDRHRSAFSSVGARPDIEKLTKFQLWFASLYCFRINPFSMEAESKKELAYPSLWLDTFTSWYRYLAQADPRRSFEFNESLKKVMDGFNLLSIQNAGENVKLLIAHFTQQNKEVLYSLTQLSEGQRCLIGLYAIRHFLLEKGCTVFIDEPDNFVGLREIQPWLMSIEDTTQQFGSQAILISHHPEILNQWAASNGVHFFRDDGGPTRLKPFQTETEGVLTAAELVARGWL